MKTIGDPDKLEELVDRLNGLRPETPALWGTLSAGEMLCHLGDAATSVLQSDASPSQVRPSRFMKWLALRAPIGWPRGLPTPQEVDPRAEGTRPTDFEADRKRAIESLREIASASAGSLLSAHGAFGPMSAGDWHRWAYRHTDHHLQQFGL